MINPEKLNDKLRGTFLKHKKTGKVAFYHKKGFRRKGSSVAGVTVIGEEGNTLFWKEGGYEIIKKPKEWKGRVGPGNPRKNRSEEAKLKKKICLKLFEEGLNRNQITKKTGYSYSVVQQALKGYGTFETKKGELLGGGDPNEEWHGRYCRICSKKIIGFNHFSCKKCHAKRVAAAGRKYLFKSSLSRSLLEL